MDGGQWFGVGAGLSSAIGAAVLPHFTPRSPTGLLLQAGATSITATWDAPTDVGTGPLTGYSVQYREDGVTAWTTFAQTGTGATATISSLTTNTTYDVRVAAVNNVGTSPFTDEESAEAVSDTTPAFATDTADRAVDENAAIPTDVGDVVIATDPNNDTLSYSITGSNPAGFTVTAGGQIQTGQMLDYETTNSYIITVEAQDPEGLADTIRVTITVNDVNEAPVFASDSVERSVAANASTGDDVGGTVTATDPDAGDSLAYSISSSTSFTIVSTSGQIQVKTGASLVEGASHTVVVTATDSDTLTDTINVNITISEVNDPPAFSATGATRTVDENESVGTNVGPAIVATDPDDGDTLTYSITGTNAAGFTVTVGGQIRTGQILDHEDTDSYTLTLQVQDAGGLTDTITVTVTVTDVNEAPAYATDTATRAVDENEASGSNVGAVLTATDPDSGDTLTYSITGTNTAGFTVDSSGQIQTGQTLDHEDTSSYTLTLRGSGRGRPFRHHHRDRDGDRCKRSSCV